MNRGSILRCEGARFAITATVVIATTTWIAYANSLDVPFYYDDHSNIVHNVTIQIDEFSMESLWTAAQGRPNPRPVAYLSFALNYLVGGLEPWGYHLVNTIIHAANGLLVCLVAQQVLSRTSGTVGDPVATPEAVRRLSLFTGLLFVAHPIQTQAVTYVVQRMASMCALFYLSALLCYLYGRGVTGRARWLWWTSGILAGLLAVGVKENALTLPAAILLCEWILFRQAKAPTLRRAVSYLAVVALAIVAAGFAWRGLELWKILISGYANREFTMMQRLLTESRVIVHYISLALLPWPSRLTLIYDYPISTSLFSPPSTFFCVIGVLGAVGSAFNRAPRYGILSFCTLWFFLHLAVESTVIPLDLVYEHRLYLPMVGFCLLVAMVLQCSLSRFLSHWWTTGALWALILTLAWGAHARNQIWREPVRFWSHNVARQPTAMRAVHNLAMAYARDRKFEESVHWLNRAVEVEPKYQQAIVMRGVVQLELGNHQSALIDLNHAIAMPEIKGPPSYKRAYEQRGFLLMEAGKLQEALEDLNRAISMRSKWSRSAEDVATLSRRATAFHLLGRYDEAISDYELTLEFDEDNSLAYNNYAWLLATCPDGNVRDGDRAVRFGERACELTNWENYSFLETLAAAHAQNGDFTAAIRRQSQCIAAAPEEQLPRLKRQLALYEAGRTVVEE